MAEMLKSIYYYDGFNMAHILGLEDLKKICDAVNNLLPELNKTINEYQKAKWGIHSDSDSYTQKDINFRDTPEKTSWRGAGLKYRNSDQI